MKVVYIPAKVKHAGIKELMSKVNIKEKFAIVSTIQFLDEVKELEKDGYKVLGQILGCNTVATKGTEVEAYLYIGTGKFHPLNLAFTSKKPVYILDPMTQEFTRITEQEVEKYEKKKKGMLLKYYNADKIGIIVSTKSGQNLLLRALKFKKTCGKKAYIFLCNNVNNLEDFQDIQCWVNTACVRIIEDDFHVPMVNIRDVENIHKEDPAYQFSFE
ncbi:MAG: diphthamide synthesis protein [bacterium]|nr:diphthamide synthesis protein [bacterium]